MDVIKNQTCQIAISELAASNIHKRTQEHNYIIPTRQLFLPLEYQHGI